MLPDIEHKGKVVRFEIAPITWVWCLVNQMQSTLISAELLPEDRGGSVAELCEGLKQRMSVPHLIYCKSLVMDVDRGELLAMIEDNREQLELALKLNCVLGDLIAIIDNQDQESFEAFKRGIA